MSLLGTLGLWSLALGALSGWLVAASIDQPQILRRLRHQAPRAASARPTWTGS